MKASFSTREQLGQLMIFSVLQAEIDDAAHASGRDVGQNLPPGGDLFALASVGHRERDADRVADAAADELLEGDARFDDAVRRHAGFGDAQVQRHIRPGGGELAVHFDHLRRIGILQRHAIAREAEPSRAIRNAPRHWRASGRANRRPRTAVSPPDRRCRNSRRRGSRNHSAPATSARYRTLSCHGFSRS